MRSRALFIAAMLLGGCSLDVDLRLTDADTDDGPAETDDPSDTAQVSCPCFEVADVLAYRDRIDQLWDCRRRVAVGRSPTFALHQDEVRLLAQNRSGFYVEATSAYDWRRTSEGEVGGVTCQLREFTASQTPYERIVASGSDLTIEEHEACVAIVVDAAEQVGLHCRE